MLENTSAPTTDVRASTEPTDRSMPRVRMTSNWPIDSTAIAAVAAITLPRLRVVKKNGERTASTATRIRRISTGPIRSSRNPSRRPR